MLRVIEQGLQRIHGGDTQILGIGIVMPLQAGVVQAAIDELFKKALQFMRQPCHGGNTHQIGTALDGMTDALDRLQARGTLTVYGGQIELIDLLR